MADALIGATGFVGSNLRKVGFSDHYNSKNVTDLHGKSFGLVVCAAAPGSMIEANRSPDRDRQKLDALVDHLSKLRADRFVLVSSVAVLAEFGVGRDETTESFETDLPYGRNRRAFEAACMNLFDDCLVLRLPSLFGAGLKKNLIFDMLNPVPSMLTPNWMRAASDLSNGAFEGVLSGMYSWDESLGMFRVDRHALNRSIRRSELEDALFANGLSALAFTHPDSTYQFYNLDWLWTDIQAALKAGIRVLNLGTEPLSAGTIHQALTGEPMPGSTAAVHREDMRTRHSAAIRGIDAPYLASGTDVLTDLRKFFDRERSTS